MSINLAISFSHPAAIAQRVKYARIDNTTSPVYTTVVPDPTTSPAVIATDIPNGQYRIQSTPIYADGRSCDPDIVDTAACPVLISINAYIVSGNLVVQYLAPSQAPKVRINVNYPNGGSFTSNYVNNGNNIVIALPTNIDGDYTVTGQSVCDETSGFYSPVSNQVVVTKTTSNTFIINTASGISISGMSGISGFILGSIVTPGNTVSGSHDAFYGAITATFTGTPAIGSSAQLKINDTVVQCVNVPNTNGGQIVFNAASFNDTDVITITFIGGYCPVYYMNSYNLAGSEMGVCSAPATTLYSAFPFGIGVTLYTDILLTVPATGSSFIGSGGIIYNMNSSTAVVGNPTGNAC